MESATENIPLQFIGVRVKWRCKRPPGLDENQGACKPHPVQDQVNSKMLSALFEERVDCMIYLAIGKQDE